MQLSAQNRRDVIEDLLDIKIFSSMNQVLKNRVKSIRDEVRTLELKKESLEEKVHMQRDFIEEVERLADTDITIKKNQITDLTKTQEDLFEGALENENQLLEKQKNLKNIVVQQKNYANLVI